MYKDRTQQKNTHRKRKPREKSIYKAMGENDTGMNVLNAIHFIVYPNMIMPVIPQVIDNKMSTPFAHESNMPSTIPSTMLLFLGRAFISKVTKSGFLHAGHWFESYRSKHSGHMRHLQGGCSHTTTV